MFIRKVQSSRSAIYQWRLLRTQPPAHHNDTNDMSKNRKSLLVEILSMPNDFAEPSEQSEDLTAVHRNAATLSRVGKILTILKYLILVAAVVSLTTVYALRSNQFIIEIKPTTQAEHADLKLKHPNLRCECNQQNIPQKKFATAKIDLVPSCTWVQKDLEKILEIDEFGLSKSACTTSNFQSACEFVQNSCRRANSTVEWITSGFAESIMTSTELMEIDKLRDRIEGELESSIKVAELISSSPQALIEAWAAYNVPKLVDMNGVIAQRVKLLSTRMSKVQQTVGDATDPYTIEWTAFKARCAASTIPGSSVITKPDGQTFTATTVCNPDTDFPQYGTTDASYSCYTEACLWGGRFREMGEGPLKVIRAVGKPKTNSFDLYDAMFPFRIHETDLSAVGYPYDGKPKGSFLDSENDALFIPETRRTCSNNDKWLETEVPPASSAATTDFVTLAKAAVYAYAPGETPPATNVTLRPSNRRGCDEYIKLLETNFFEIDSLETMQANYAVLVKDIKRLIGKAAVDPSFIVGKTAAEFTAIAAGFLRKLEYINEFLLEGTDGTMHSSTGVSYSNNRQAFQKNFVNQSSVELTYSNYFDACDIKVCTYVTNAQLPITAVFSILLGIIGGFWSVIEVLFSSTYKVSRWYILNETSRNFDDSVVNHVNKV